MFKKEYTKLGRDVQNLLMKVSHEIDFYLLLIKSVFQPNCDVFYVFVARRKGNRKLVLQKQVCSLLF